ncbi:MAG: peptidase MA family metallohydrolase [Bacteroidetes bacterium]|nr:peptidase MA family metallohydrolase [Rhodothermia bacterium]MCX7907347.1 peptidase MA family metallohydrolase [Bacteroidota bacterium]MDW8286222.1 peptidase MA family metallohydrolase [Bacteroidota bacterium]
MWRFLIALCALGLASGAAQAQYFSFGQNKIQYRKFDWKYIQSKHFDVYFYSGGEYLADFTARAAEEAYERIRKLFRYDITNRIPIIVYNSHTDFQQTNVLDMNIPEGVGGVTELFKNRIVIPFEGDYRQFRHVIHHELVHAVINDMFYGGSLQSVIQNNIQLQIPLWFNEGLAEYSPLRWDSNSDMFIRDAIVHNYLSPIPALDGYFAYRGGQSVWDYIAQQYGEEKIGEILQRLRTSRNVELAFRRAIGMGVMELSERWQRALKVVHWPELAAREDIEDLGRRITSRRNAGTYNTSPALSPKGDLLAFITNRNLYFDIVLVSALDGRSLGKLASGEINPNFEQLKILTPNLTWSPDGSTVAVATYGEGMDAIALIDVKTRRVRRIPIRDVHVFSVNWSPTGNQIAFMGIQNYRSDIWLYDLSTAQLRNLTDDVFSDSDPAWSPDGRYIVFSSDRGEQTEPGRHRERFSMFAYNPQQLDLYRIEVATGRMERLTRTAHADETRPQFGSDPDRVLFISDRNGIYNVWELNLRTGQERPITNVLTGIQQISVSNDGSRMAMTALREGYLDIFVMNNPFGRRTAEGAYRPTVWGQRMLRERRDTLQAPVLALATAELLQRNPLLRAVAGSGSPPTTAPDSVRTAEARPDTSAYGRLRVDFRNYVFGEAFREAAARSETADKFNPVEAVTDSGQFIARPYRINFTADLIYGSAGYDVVYGVQGVTQMQFSDLMGNHQLFLATNLLIDLRNSDYFLSYRYLPRRTDYGFLLFHTARIFLDYSPDGLYIDYYRYRTYGVGASASYPFDRFRRLDADFSLVTISRTNISSPLAEPTQRVSFLYPALTYTVDRSIWGYTTPVRGTRYAVSLTGSPPLWSGALRFVSVLADGRRYWMLGSPWYTIATRLAGGASFGPDAQLYYIGGVEGWLNPIFSYMQFPITKLSDFLFATPILPLRGFDFNAASGNRFVLWNTEFRFPLFAAIVPGPVPILPLYNLQGVLFCDVGAVFRNADFRMYQINNRGEQVFRDLYVGAGFGLRTILLGFPLRLDFAWPYDGQRFGRSKTYISIGLDF